MQVTTKFSVGDITKQGEIYSVKFQTEKNKGTEIRYWVYGGKKFYSESELEEVGSTCESCGRKGVTR